MTIDESDGRFYSGKDVIFHNPFGDDYLTAHVMYTTEHIISVQVYEAENPRWIDELFLIIAEEIAYYKDAE